MLRVFNCGVGMALVVRNAEAAMAHLLELGEQAVVIGRIVACEGEAEARVSVPEGWLD
jgi:phosphoribosylformylglycinamidine cyclo-ligase